MGQPPVDRTANRPDRPCWREGSEETRGRLSPQARLSLFKEVGSEEKKMKKLEIDEAVERGEPLYPWDIEWKRQVDRVRGILKPRMR